MKNSVQTNDNLMGSFDRGNVLSTKCPSREVLKHVTSRWGLLVFFVLRNGEPQRFSAIRKQIDGVSEKMLAQTLQQLEADGFVDRIVYPVVPPHVEYQLTDFGIQFGGKVFELVDWLESNLIELLSSTPKAEQTNH